MLNPNQAAKISEIKANIVIKMKRILRYGLGLKENCKKDREK